MLKSHNRKAQPLGNDTRPQVYACYLSNGNQNQKRMEVRRENVKNCANKNGCERTVHLWHLRAKYLPEGNKFIYLALSYSQITSTIVYESCRTRMKWKICMKMYDGEKFEKLKKKCEKLWEQKWLQMYSTVYLWHWWAKYLPERNKFIYLAHSHSQLPLTIHYESCRTRMKRKICMKMYDGEKFEKFKCHRTEDWNFEYPSKKVIKAYIIVCRSYVLNERVHK